MNFIFKGKSFDYIWAYLYNNLMKHLQKILKGKHTLIFIDFEGTQFTHEIIAGGLYKCKVDDEGKIIEECDDGLLFYSKPRTTIGKIVSQMTSITDAFLKENGLSWEESINKMQEYIGEDLDDTLFVCFGSNDPKMILESCRLSHTENSIIAKSWLNNFFDFLAFSSQYIRDEHNNTYSLVNYLKLYDIEPVGISHNPLNDAKDLKNLYQAFIEKTDIAFCEYKKILAKLKTLPAPIKQIVDDLLNGKSVNPSQLDELIKDYLA